MRPPKVAATTAAFAESFANRPVWGIFELFTFSSLNPAFLPRYAGSLHARFDRAMVLFDPSTVAHRHLPPLAAEAVQAAFGPGVEVFTDAKALRAVLEREAPEELNLLIMSSGNVGGWDVRQWAPEFVQQSVEGLDLGARTVDAEHRGEIRPGPAAVCERDPHT